MSPKKAPKKIPAKKNKAEVSQKKTPPEYSHTSLEKKWLKTWESKKPFTAKNNGRKKFYALVEFPYPSGDGLHTGHVRSYTALDVLARKRRREGYNVLYPIGWDAFGLPAENYAIKTGIHPSITTKKNIDTFRRQLKALGISFDWSREINTTDPGYYKWTQWIFLQLYKNGLAYKKSAFVNWCPKDKTVLANEEVIDGKCERCGTPTLKKDKVQWTLAITKYADRLDKDLDTVDYLPKIKAQQRNWIGRSEGAEITFKISGTERVVRVFTTRLDTIFGATYLVLSPEHPLLQELRGSITNFDQVRTYIETAKAKSELERTNDEKGKTGIELKGFKALNPATKKEIPLFVADYVLNTYGTGALMAVPAHDSRDHAFAKAFNLPSLEVVIPNRIDMQNPPLVGKVTVERKNVHAIVRNPKTEKYLLLKWHAHPWITFPMGGIEKGESALEAAKREVEEETGYTNLKYVKTLGGVVRAEYFAAHKDENRVAYTQAIMFDLLDESKVTISKEETNSYTQVWFSKSDIVYPKVAHSELSDWLARWENTDFIYTEEGVLCNSGACTGLTSREATKKLLTELKGTLVTRFKLRDWVFSRQRYWGEPIPIIHCEKCGMVPVPEKDLPVILPKVKSYIPTDSGESPLALIKSWVNVKCPSCKGKAKRETDTMPQWAGSSWYFLRYIDPKNKKAIADKKLLKYWTPVDWYNGGMEHTTLHLLYSRFWHKFLYDIKVVPTYEPYVKRTSHGIVLAEGGVKMSKSKGNTISPDPIIVSFGADTLRIYEMFMGPFDQPIGWSTDGVVGSRRFIERVFRLSLKVGKETKLQSESEFPILLNQSIKKIGEDIEELKMNTAVSQLMILLNELEKMEKVPVKAFESFLLLLAPFAPFITEELWSTLGHTSSIHTEKWPKADRKKLTRSTFTLAISVNGKLRGTLLVSIGAKEAEIVSRACAVPSVAKWLTSPLKKQIFVPGKILNLIV